MITEEITQRLIPVVRRQAARGGIRLARLLDEAFQPDSPWLRPPRALAQLIIRGTTVTARRFCAQAASFDSGTAGRSLPQLITCIRPGETPRDSR